MPLSLVTQGHGAVWNSVSWKVTETLSSNWTYLIWRKFDLCHPFIIEWDRIERMGSYGDMREKQTLSWQSGWSLSPADKQVSAWVATFPKRLPAQSLYSFHLRLHSTYVRKEVTRFKAWNHMTLGRVSSTPNAHITVNYKQQHYLQ